MRRLWRVTTSWRCSDERGQSIVLLAGAMVALLVFVGLAVDAGVIYIGSLHLSRAVDAAALAGVVELPRDDASTSVPFERRTAHADDKAQDFLWANGITYTVNVPLPEFFQSRREAGVVGSYRYCITATHQVDLYFLPLVNFTHVKLVDTALAEYNPWVDIYTNQGASLTVNQSFKGRNEASARGDAFSPTDSFWYEELQGKYVYRVFVPDGYPHPTVRVEILDPDDYDAPFPASVTITDTGGATRSATCNGPTCATGDPANPAWFLGMDEGTSDNPIGFTLFYYKLAGDGRPERVDIASYTSQAGASGAATDMRWICPDGFEVALDALSAAYRADGGLYVYMEAESQGAHTENSFDLWAGPPYPDAPTNINARNLYSLKISSSQVLPSDGVVVYAVGHMAYNSNALNRVEMQLTDIPSAWAGRKVRIDYFDVDTNTQPPFIFYFDTVPQKDWQKCYDDAGFCDTPPGRERCGGTAGGGCADTRRFGYTCADFGEEAGPFGREGRAWLVDRYDPGKGECGYANPADQTSNDRWRAYEFVLPPKETFYGGRLLVSYGGGNMDNVTFRMMVEATPRLMK